jgi:hypothetical protein
VCGNSARTDLCGGRSAMGVPTAISVEMRVQTRRFVIETPFRMVGKLRISGSSLSSKLRPITLERRRDVVGDDPLRDIDTVCPEVTLRTLPVPPAGCCVRLPRCAVH